jgi:hypothetical protein
MKITRTNPFNAAETSTMDLPVTLDQVDAYMQGVNVQDAFPQLDAAQREFIKTGITDDIWNEIFAD